MRPVRTSTDDATRRAAIRYPIDAASHLAIAGNPGWPVRVTDISSGGARLADLGDPRAGDSGTIRIDGIRRPPNIKAMSEDGGVSFVLDEEASKALDSWLAGMAREIAA